MKFKIKKLDTDGYWKSCSGSCEHTDEIKRLCINTFGDFDIKYVVKFDCYENELGHVGDEFHEKVPSLLTKLMRWK